MGQIIKLTERRLFNEVNSKPQPALPTGTKLDLTALGESQSV